MKDDRHKEACSEILDKTNPLKIDKSEVIRNIGGVRIDVRGHKRIFCGGSHVLFPNWLYKFVTIILLKMFELYYM